MHLLSLLVRLLWIALLGVTITAEADPLPQPLKIGVLAYKGKEAALREWAAHADYLSRRLAPLRFEAVPLGYEGDELTHAVATHRVDFVITNPGHYIELELAGHATRIATRRMQGPAGILDRFGGTAVTRAGRVDLTDYRSLKGKQVLIPSTSSLGGWQVHLREGLAQGIDLREESRITELHDHQKVISAVLRGEADAGFVRSDLIEEMARDGRLDPQRLRLINPRQEPGYPYLLSTRLYPEWPFALVHGTDPDLAVRVLAALLEIPADSPAARAAGIQGWTVPGDYHTLADLYREARLGPFARERLSLYQILGTYWPAFTLALLLLVFLLSAGLLNIARSRMALRRSESLLRQSQEIGRIGSWRLDPKSGRLDGSNQLYGLLGLNEEPGGLSFEQALARVHPDDRGAIERLFQEGLHDGKPREFSFRIPSPDGTIRYLQGKMEYSLDDMGHAKTVTGILHDVSERQQAERQIRLAASVFEHAAEGIIITDERANILDVNAAFIRLTGYSRGEVVGKNPRVLQSGRHPPEFYQQLWSTLQRQGIWRGEVWNRRKNGQSYIEQLTISAVQTPEGKVSHYIGIFTDITQLKAHQNELEFMAHHDALTQLPNRALLADRLNQARARADRSRTLLAVAYIDLDGFKQINDTHGHEIGDRLLVETAGRLLSCLRAGDSVARLGGDEFVILLTDLPSKTECENALGRVLHSLAEPYLIEGHRLGVSASIGVALYRLDQTDPETLLRHADQAMYTAKQSGRNRFHYYDPELDRLNEARSQFLDQVKAALEQGEFRLYYQPVVDMRSGVVTGMEALLRWERHDRLVLPAEVLPPLEHTELSIRLGDWVLQTACAQLDAWRRQGLDLSVCVNIAVDQLLHPDFVPSLKRQLDAHPAIPPERLQLEIMETAALGDQMKAAKVMHQCRALGVRFALDDFGTGYSSLAYFKRLPFDTLKIDRGFVQDMLEDEDDYSIVDGVINLARAFRREVVAEGVESIQHGVALLQMGCDKAQGFGIAQPMPAEQVTGWLAGFQPPTVWADSLAHLWPRHDMPLLLAELNFDLWVEKMRGFLGDGQVPPILDPHQCQFGRWYDGAGAREYQEMEAFRQLAPLHAKVHQIGQELYDLKRTGRDQEALQGIPLLSQLRDELCGRVDELVKAVRRSPQSASPTPPAPEGEGEPVGEGKGMIENGGGRG